MKTIGKANTFAGVVHVALTRFASGEICMVGSQPDDPRFRHRFTEPAPEGVDLADDEALFRYGIDVEDLVRAGLVESLGKITCPPDSFWKELHKVRVLVGDAKDSAGLTSWDWDREVSELIECSVIERMADGVEHLPKEERATWEFNRRAAEAYAEFSHPPRHLGAPAAAINAILEARENS